MYDGPTPSVPALILDTVMTKKEADEYLNELTEKYAGKLTNRVCYQHSDYSEFQINNAAVVNEHGWFFFITEHHNNIAYEADEILECWYTEMGTNSEMIYLR